MPPPNGGVQYRISNFAGKGVYGISTGNGPAAVAYMARPRGVALTSRWHTFEAETLAGNHLTRQLFGAMVRRIAALPVPNG